MKYRAELREVAIARDAVMFLPAILPLLHLVDGLNIVRNNKLPITETLAEHFISLPAEETLRRGRPAQHAKLVVPLDDGERRVFNVKGQTLVVVRRCCFRDLAIGHVANDGDATDDVTLFVMTRRVVAVEKALPTGLRDHVRTVLGD